LPAGGRFASCYLTIPDTLFETLLMYVAIPITAASLLHPGPRPEIPARMDEILTELRTAPPGATGRGLLLAHALLMDIYNWHRQSVQPTPEEIRLAEARRQLSADLDDRFPLADLASRLGCGYSKFRKDFRAQTGLSPGEYRIRRRIERARELLNNGTFSVKEIAFRLGYPDVQAFSRQFRRCTGQSPRQYQQAACPYLRASRTPR